MRAARRGTGATMAINEDRINALDELGFEWWDMPLCKYGTTRTTEA